MLSNAEHHAEIAKRVYLDKKIMIVGDYCIVEGLGIFNLLDCDPPVSGKSSMRAKAFALDVLMWLNTGGLPFGHMLFENVKGNPCAAIFKAAKEVIDDK